MVKKSTSNFGASVSALLAEVNMSQAAFARSVGKSQPYTNQVITGERKPSEAWVELASQSLKLSEQVEKELRVAAIRDCGFKL